MFQQIHFLLTNWPSTVQKSKPLFLFILINVIMFGLLYNFCSALFSSSHICICFLVKSGPYLFQIVSYNKMFFYSDWETLLLLRNIIRSFIDFLMETYGHHETNDQYLDEIMNFRDSLCSVLCKLVEK